MVNFYCDKMNTSLPNSELFVSFSSSDYFSDLWYVLVIYWYNFAWKIKKPLSSGAFLTCSCSIDQGRKDKPFLYSNIIPSRNPIVSGFLAHLVMSLYNHALSVMCHCHCHPHWWHCWCLYTALPVTDLIIETSYLINICSYILSICIWNIKSI